MISFSVGETRLRIYFSFLLFNAVVFTFSSQELLFQFYTACVLHEAGHILSAAVIGTHIKSISFSGSGIRILTDKRLCSAGKSALVILSGPAVNIILFAVLRELDCGGSFPMLNLAAGLYNLLPYRQLDGGALIDNYIMGSVHERTARAVLVFVKAAISVALAYLTFIKGTEILPLFGASLLLFISDILMY